MAADAVSYSMRVVVDPEAALLVSMQTHFYKTGSKAGSNEGQTRDYANT